MKEYLFNNEPTYLYYSYVCTSWFLLILLLVGLITFLVTLKNYQLYIIKNLKK